MAKRKTEKPVYAFVRRGNGLYPELLIDARALEGVAQGERVKVEIKQWRNLDRHRLYWKMLNKIVEATDCVLSPERLHQALKMELGVVDLLSLPSGMRIAVPGSIDFDQMDEPEFSTFFNRAVEWLAVTYGIDPLEFYQKKAA